MVEGECEIMEAIGGYFELELHKGEEYHKDAISLNTARNCFEYILLARNYKKVYIPYYTCEVMLQPLEKHHISYEYYSINDKTTSGRSISLYQLFWIKAELCGKVGYHLWDTTDC